MKQEHDQSHDCKVELLLLNRSNPPSHAKFINYSRYCQNPQKGM